LGGSVMSAPQHSVKVATKICPVFRTLTGEPPPDRLRVICRLDPPAFDISEFPGFTVEQVILGLTVPATQS
jgi:hypothetical protein